MEELAQNLRGGSEENKEHFS